MSLAVLFAQQDPDPFRIITEFLSSPVLRITAQLILLLFVVAAASFALGYFMMMRFIL